jgi:glycosyltransferase involved in cell wall biosynthesis
MASVTLLLTAPRWRGSATSFAKIARGLVKAGHTVRLVTSAESVAQGFRALGLDASALELADSGLGSARRLRRVLSADLVIADAPRDVRLAALATLGRATRLYWRFNLPNRPVPGDVLARALFRRLDGMVCQSDFAATLLRAGAPWLADVPVHRIANGYDTERLAPSAERAERFRRAYDLAPDAPMVLTVGALSPEKGLPAAIVASEMVRASHPGLIHCLVGDGQDEAALRGSAPSHVRFLGALDAEATADAMRAADVVLLPSAREIFPNVVAEAMALGRAVVTVRGGAAPEVAGDAALLVEPGNARAVADAVATLLNDPAHRVDVGARARARIAAEFGLERMEEAYARLVNAVRGDGGLVRYEGAVRGGPDV